MKQSLQYVRVGLFFVLGLILIFVTYSVIGNNQFGKKDGYLLVAQFNDLKTLTPGSDVRMAGVRIGEVAETKLVEGKAQAVLRIDSKFQIPSDSIASIGVASLLGQNYIAVNYGQSQSMVQDGARIETKNTADFNDIMNEVSQLSQKFNQIADSFSGFGEGDMGNLFTNLNDMVTENRAQLDTIVDRIDSITMKIDSGEGTLGKLINDDTAYTRAVETLDEIKLAATDARATLDEAQTIIADVKAGKGSIGRLLYDDTAARELEETIANFNEFSLKLNKGEGTLGKLVNDDELYVELRAMLQKAEQTLDTVGDAGPISAVGTAAGALF
ncbi:MAG: MlaD family protein [Verrucomicrobiota bacterium JB022]|nr:MlaD family protein [Verrucomicrobiota bacterium JB022]